MHSISPHYDKTGAAAALSTITDVRANNPHSQLQLGKMFQIEGNHYRAEKDGTIWRLVYNNSTHGEMEEVVVSVQGVLSKNGLPPFLNMIPTNSANTRYLKQSVQITGYGNQSFERLRNDMARIFAIFKRTIGPQLQDEGVVSQEDGFVAIDTSNRYFSVRSESNQGDECDITEDMDPKGHLRKAAGTKYIHAEDNRVCYFEKYEDCEGGACFKEARPQIFHAGDIVELQVSFIVVPLRDQNCRMNIILRSISLLEGKFTQDAIVKAASKDKTGQANPTKTTLKRKVGYTDEGVSITRSKLTKLKIGEAPKEDEMEGVSTRSV